MAGKVANGGDWFEQLTGGPWVDVPDKIYKFPVRVAMPKWRPSRHECFEFVLEMGRGEVLRALAGQPMRDQEPLIVFPERYISVQEQYIFMSAIAKNPKPPKVFRLVTQSPLIIGNFTRTMIRIVTWPEDEGVFDESALNRFK